MLVTADDSAMLRAVSEVLGASIAEVASGLVLVGLQYPEDERGAAIAEMERLPTQLLATRIPTACHSVIRSLGSESGGIPITVMGGALVRLGLRNLSAVRQAVADAAAIALDPAAAEDLISQHLGGMPLAI